MSRWLVTLWSCARSRRTSAANSWALGATAGSLPSSAGGWRGVRPGELSPPRAQALGGDAQALGDPPCRHAALPLRDRCPLERLVVGPVRCAPVFVLSASLLMVLICLHPEPLSTLSGQSQHFLAVMNLLRGFSNLVPGVQIRASKLDDAHDRQHDGKQPGRTAAEQHP